jgi:hypothetical protein
MTMYFGSILAVDMISNHIFKYFSSTDVNQLIQNPWKDRLVVSSESRTVNFISLNNIQFAYYFIVCFLK